ncbi:MAG: hypothetical protein IIZ57_01880, partial [Solobacterium sp.]|nr:hypothetical protein [Solobacterium sp.]
MSYTAPAYFLMIAVLSVFYYLVPKQHRYLVLLAGSMLFYFVSAGRIVLILFFLLTTAFAYCMGILLERASDKKRIILSIGWAVLLAPLLVNRARDFLLRGQWNSWVLPVGISFYTMQLCAYLSDIAHGKIT